MASTEASRVAKPARRPQTCDICKARHQKCNGVRPTCNNCELRGLNCSYSGIRPTRPSESSSSSSSQHKSSRVDSTLLNSDRGRLAITDSQYARLRDQLLDDILRGFYSKGDSLTPSQSAAGQVHDRLDTDAAAQFQVGNASLSQFHQQITELIKASIPPDASQIPPTGSSTEGDQHSRPPLMQNTSHARRIMADSLPDRHKAQRLLDMFFNYQNSIFYVCSQDEAQAQLQLMFQDTGQVSLAWFCQMFLMFAVGAQFDDEDDDEGQTYYELGRKYMDDALDINPDRNHWVVRAMLLICFYQPATKWTTLWMYLDTAIRRAHRSQLDLGQSQATGMGSEEHMEWRRIWLSLISFDRWVAIFLGRLPHIKESISRDLIFKNENFQNLDQSVLQNAVTSLAIIMGYILREMYFIPKPDRAVYDRHETRLDTWLKKLPPHTRRQLESGDIEKDPIDQHEATFNLFFMHLGAWMILTKPMLLWAVKTTMTTKTLTTSAYGTACVQYAIRLISSSPPLLMVSLPSKQLFMPVFYLVYASHVVILGLGWKIWSRGLQESAEGSQQTALEPETTAMDTALRVLDFVGQRNSFARKYASLMKELRRQLEGNGAPLAERPSNSTSPSSGAESISPFTTASQILGLTGLPLTGFSDSGSRGPGSTMSPEQFTAQEIERRGSRPTVETPGRPPSQSQQSPMSTNYDNMNFDMFWLGGQDSTLFPGMSNQGMFNNPDENWE
ncbi:hypothetical protein F5884DRAFT_859157 [Xylogone sp. PMI_703]|nr:hypothetical protein F5884DRAFT_859157 [Xylogone sp. PMI_703]